MQGGDKPPVKAGGPATPGTRARNVARARATKKAGSASSIGPSTSTSTSTPSTVAVGGGGGGGEGGEGRGRGRGRLTNHARPKTNSNPEERRGKQTRSTRGSRNGRTDTGNVNYGGADNGDIEGDGDGDGSSGSGSGSGSTHIVRRLAATKDKDRKPTVCM